MLTEELNYFETHLGEWLGQYQGKYVLIKGEKLVGTYTSIQDALLIGYQQFKKEPFFVRQIVPVQEAFQFHNSLFK